MNKDLNADFESELINLFNKYYGENWEYTYENQNSGFDLSLWITNQQENEDE
jgi:hypothetical protein